MIRQPKFIKPLESYNPGVLFLLIIFCFFYGCEPGNHNNIDKNKISSTIKFRKADEFSFPLEKGQYLVPVKLKVDEEKASVSFIDYKRKKILIGDLETGSYKRDIDIGLYNRRTYIQNYKVISNDSIILTHNPTFFGDFHNDVIFIINGNKEIIDSFSFKGAKVNLRGQKEWPTHEDYYLDFTYFPIIYNKKEEEIVAPMASYNLLCDSFYHQNKNLGLLGSVSSYSKEGHGFSKWEYVYPCSNSKKYYWTNAKYLRGAHNTSEGEALVGTGHSNRYSIFNLEGNHLKSISIPWSINGKPEPNFIKEENKPFTDLKNPEYLDIRYDENTSGYWIMARTEIRNNYSNLLKNYPLHEMIFVNEDLTKFSKGLLPFGYSELFVPYKEGLLVYNKKKSTKENKVVLSYFKTYKEPYDSTSYAKEYESIIKRVNDRKAFTKQSYLRSYEKKKKNYLLVPLEASCPTCIKELKPFLKKYEDTLKSKFSVILIASNKSIVKEFVNSTNLNSDGWIHNDISGKWEKYFTKWYNLKLIQTNKSGDIRFEKRYKPLDLLKLFSKMKEMS